MNVRTGAEGGLWAGVISHSMTRIENEGSLDRVVQPMDSSSIQFLAVMNNINVEWHTFPTSRAS